MRPVSLFLAFGLLIGVAPFGLSADPVMPAPLQPGEVEYRLGGAALQAARIPTQSIASGSSGRLKPLLYPDRTPDETVPVVQTDLADFAFFRGDVAGEGQDVLRLGSALTRGPATAGFAITFEDGTTESRSEVFVDYALSTRLRLGLAGILQNRPVDTPSRLGMTAAYATDEGAFVQGGIAHAPNASPVFGLSLGLRF